MDDRELVEDAERDDALGAYARRTIERQYGPDEEEDDRRIVLILPAPDREDAS